MEKAGRAKKKLGPSTTTEVADDVEREKALPRLRLGTLSLPRPPIRFSNRFFKGLFSCASGRFSSYKKWAGGGF
jgi:hypothetical protein